MLALSFVIGPPEDCCLVLSLRLKSGLISLQAHSAIGGFEKHLAGIIKSARIVRRKNNRLRPSEAIFQPRRAASVRIIRPRRNGLRCPVRLSNRET